MKEKNKEIEQILDRLRVGIHSSDGINRLHWVSFADFIIHNPIGTKKQLVHMLISVMGIRERTVMEYVNCALAWGVLELSGGELRYVPIKSNGKKLRITKLPNTDIELKTDGDGNIINPYYSGEK